MSQYMEFYVKGNNNEYVPIGCFSRGSEVYQTVDEVNCATYEKVVPLKINDVEFCIDELNRRIENMNKLMANQREMLGVIMNAPDPLEQKLEMYESYMGQIQSSEEYKEELVRAKYFFDAWLYAMYEAQSTECYSHEELRLNADNYLFVGWEAGNPNRMESE